MCKSAKIYTSTAPMSESVPTWPFLPPIGKKPDSFYNKNMLIRLIFTMTLLISATCFASPEFIKKLEDIYENIDFIQKEISKNSRKLSQTNSQTIKKNIEEKIGRLQANLEEANSNLFEHASGFSLKDSKVKKEEVPKDLMKEIRDILAPVLNGLKRISAKPRRIEDLKEKIELLDSKHEESIQALTKIEVLLKEVKGPLKVKLENGRDQISRIKDQFFFQKEESNRKLETELENNKSFFSATAEIIQIFFKTKGKHLLLSLISLISIFWLLINFRRRIFKSSLFTNNLREYEKPIYLAYNILAGLFAIIGALLALYILHDWVMVTFFVLVLSALIWTSKQFIPQFIEEGKFILNLGTVREAERIVLDGIPWRVKKLGFRTLLTNDLLEGGRLYIYARELLNKQSRPQAPNEAMFPTAKGDWVELSDGAFGEVILQTPEQVLIQLRDSKTRHYKTNSFLELSPQNYSKGFWVETQFGLDYGIQENVPLVIPSTFKQSLTEKMQKTRFTKLIPDIDVQFHSAAASSLNLWIKVQCEGILAKDKSAIERSIQRFCVEICNENQFNIPFDQLTLHMNKSEV
jgi:hypothetical protein